MTAITNLIEETSKLDRYSKRNFDHAIREITRIEAIIKALLDVALDLQNQLSNLVILQIELALPLEGEKSELPAKGEGVSQEIIDYAINIGPVNIYSMAGALGDTFAKFEAQTAGIAGIYAPYAFSEASQAVTPGLFEMLAKGSEDAANIGWDAVHDIGIEAPEKIVPAYDKTLSLRTETLYKGLKKSALIINELETLRDRMANISVERERLPAGADMPARVPDTLVLAEQKQRNGVIARSEIFRDIEEFSNYVNHFSVAMDKTSTALHTKILEAHEVTDIALNKISVKASQPAGLTKGEQHPVTYLGQRMIEIPVFMPREKVSMPAEETAINAARLSDAIEKEYSEKDTISFSRESLSAPTPPYAAALPSLSAPSTYVSNAFETISDYITIASEIDRQMIELTEESRQVTSKIIAPLHLLTTGNEASAALNLDRIAFRGYGGIASEGQAMNIALSMAATETLQRAGSSAIKDITAAVPPSGAGIRGLTTAAMPRAIENILQIFSAPTKETASVAQTGGRASFQNTFNIVVNVKGGGEESELRDLGRKIGLILSEEIKRYGGIG